MYSKYNVGKKSTRTYNGLVFQSKNEMKRYRELLLLQKSGAITDLQLQTPFVLLDNYVKNGKKIQGVKYNADFTYYENGNYVVEDVKGVKTDVYKIKKKLFEYRYPDLEIRETGAVK